MPLTLCIQTCRGQLMPMSGTVRFDSFGGTIGRAADSVLVLDDPDKHISRIQARIVWRDEGYHLRDLGRNPSFVNGLPLGHGRETQLENGDQLEIGAYVIAVNITPEKLTPEVTSLPFQALSTPSLALFDVAYSALNVDGELDDIVDNAGFEPLGLNLFDNLPAAPIAAFCVTEHQHVSPECRPLSKIACNVKTVPLPIPDDYDPLADLLPPRLPQTTTVLAPIQQTHEEKFGSQSCHAVLHALLKGLNLPDLKKERSVVELAEMVGMQLREAMDLLSRRSATSYENQCERMHASYSHESGESRAPNAE